MCQGPKGRLGLLQLQLLRLVLLLCVLGLTLLLLPAPVDPLILDATQLLGVQGRKAAPAVGREDVRGSGGGQGMLNMPMKLSP